MRRVLNSSSSIGRNRTVARSFIEWTGMVSGNGNGHDEKIVAKPRRAPAVPSAFHRLFAPCGWLLGRRLLLLINVGRRTGKIHRTVLEVADYRPALPEAIVLSAFGTRADWLLNIQTQTPIEIVIASRRFVATHRFLDEEEATAALLGYQHRNRSIAPLIRFALGRFVGWRYDGSPAHARRLVRQLPVVGFRPAAVVPLSCAPSGSIVRPAAGLRH